MDKWDDQDNVRSIGAARFNRNTDPAAHDPITALDAAYDWIKSLDQKPEHIIVLIGREMSDGASGTQFFQAGNYPYHAQQGLCSEGALMIRESS